MRNWLFVGIFLMAASAQAATTPSEDIAEYQASLAANMKDVGTFLADPLGRAFAFSTGSQSFSPVAAKGFLHFNLGVGVGVNTTIIDKSGAKASAKTSGTDISAYASSLPDSLPVPLGSLNAHLGLPGFLIFDSTDVGLRLAALNLANGTTTIDISGGGLEFRGNVLEEGLTVPVTLTLGLSVDQLKVAIRSLGSAEALNSSYGGYTRTGTIKYGMDVDSATTATALKVAVSRKFLFIRPFAGAAVQVLSGDTSVRGYETGTVTSTGPGGPPASSSATIEGKGSKPSPGMDVRLAAGVEVDFFFLYLALGGEYGVVSGGSGGNGQLGLKF